MFVYNAHFLFRCTQLTHTSLSSDNRRFSYRSLWKSSGLVIYIVALPTAKGRKSAWLGDSLHHHGHAPSLFKLHGCIWARVHFVSLSLSLSLSVQASPTSPVRSSPPLSQHSQQTHYVDIVARISHPACTSLHHMRSMSTLSGQHQALDKYTDARCSR